MYRMMRGPWEKFGDEGERMQKKTVKVKRVTTRKLVLWGLIGMIFGGLVVNTVLSALDKQTLVQEVCEMIRLFSYDFIAYMLADSVDHTSANKYGIDIEKED